MNKFFITAFAACFAVLALISSCKDSVSEVYIPDPEDTTDVDTIVEAKYDEDFLYSYDITLAVDTTVYRSVEIEFDTTEFLTRLGYASGTEFVTAMGTLTESAQTDNTLDFFAIAGSTGYDYLQAYTANGYGFWFDVNGDITTWEAEGEAAKLFTEFYPEDGMFFNVGQYPSRLVTGDEVTLVLMFENDDVRIAFEFNITGGEYYVEEVPELETVSTVDVAISATQDNSYATTAYEIDVDAAASALGISVSEMISGATFYGYSSDGTYTAEFTANAGYWYTAEGDITNYGDGAAMFIEYADSSITIGQYPSGVEVGSTYSAKVALEYDYKAVVFNIDYTIIDYVDPEETPAGDPTDVTFEYSFNQVYTGEWPTPEYVDVKETLKDAFKMTTYQIHQAIESGELVFSGFNADGTVYTDDDGNIISTANAPGHWYGATGDVTTYASTDDVAVIYSELGHTNTTLQFGIGHYPDNAAVGTSVTFTQVAELNGGKATFNFTITLVEE